ncbi:MFS transporter [Lentzea sp. NBRC 105346]|nr:MFS transporter [Lentzea sp. NBRC 105346]
MLVPLALAQFICSFAGSNMNVMINDISADLDTDVHGVQLAITIFLVVMAALMVPGGKLTDRWGRKRCFTLGLVLYGIGAVLSAVAPGLPVLILGNSILEGIGTALLIPPVYILTTVHFAAGSRARAFGVISAMGGVGAATGPLIGGLITSAISWRAAFVFQAAIVALIAWMARKIVDPIPADPTRPFDLKGAVLSAAGLVLIVVGILAADDNLWLFLGLIGLGFVVLARFFHTMRTRSDPLLSPDLFRNRTANLGLVTQHVQWLLLMGISFVVATYFQVIHGYSAVHTGLIFTSATAGILVSSLAAGPLTRRFQQRNLIVAGFLVTFTGIVLLLTVRSVAWPGLLVIGLGLGGMLTPSVNVVQSSFPEARQGEISGVSRSVSNLGSALGTAIAGTVLVAGLTDHDYALALVVLAVMGVVGLVGALRLPVTRA